MSVKVISPEEALEFRIKLLDKIYVALVERRPDSDYPANTKLANTLWSVMKLWEDGRYD